jgi:hypothetical protein
MKSELINLQKKLDFILNVEDINPDKVLSLSQELDEIIVEYYQYLDSTEIKKYKCF